MEACRYIILGFLGLFIALFIFSKKFINAFFAYFDRNKQYEKDVERKSSLNEN